MVVVEPVVVVVERCWSKITNETFKFVVINEVT
jgi:hypothetical protein